MCGATEWWICIAVDCEWMVWTICHSILCQAQLRTCPGMSIQVLSGPGIAWPRVLSYLCSEPQSDHWCIVWRRPFKNRYLWLGDVHLHAAVHSRCLTIAVYQQQMFEVVVLWSDIHVVTDHRAFVVLEISCVSLWIAALCYIVNCSKAVKTRSESSLLCRLSV